MLATLEHQQALADALRGRVRPVNSRLNRQKQPEANSGGHVLPLAVARWNAEAPARERAREDHELLAATMPAPETVAAMDGGQFQMESGTEQPEPVRSNLSARPNPSPEQE